MGRPTKATSELTQTGTYRKDRHGGRMENNADPLEEVEAAPAHFTADQKALYYNVAELTLNNGLLTRMDYFTLCRYVECTFGAQDCQREINEKGYVLDNDKKNPACEMLMKYYTILEHIEDRFGFNPKARQSIKSTPKAKEKPGDNLFK